MQPTLGIMNAVRIHEFGGPEVLLWEDVPIPEPGAGQILVKVHAAGVNPVDGKIRTGKFKRFRPKLPAILGRDFSGVIVRLGEDVTDWKIGDEVFGMLDYARGAYAEYCVALPSEVVHKPEPLEHLRAGSIGVAGQTAWQALFRCGELHTGQRVLIHGAGGGVGHFAVQLATAHGAEVIATVSPEDAEFVSEIGAVETIDYKRERFEERVHDVDLVVDLVGGETVQRSWHVLRPGGILVSTLGDPHPPASAPVGTRGREVIVECQPYQMEKIAAQAAAGQLRIELDHIYPLAHADQAHEHLEHDHARGKTVLSIAEDQ
jgi:NADPH:quinone reductase-like Zn-dependent oxidoreductase